ncbi:MAG: hypothetical protein L0H83_16275, partial [Salinisphaera sp.]|nr:hypothetical protein [Salinisphaera sp.]
MARPIIRYTTLAQALSRDGLREDAIKEAYGELCKALDAFAARYPEALQAAIKDVRQMDGATIVLGVHSREVTDSGSFSEVADDRAIDAEYSNAGRRLTAELAKRYADHIADDEDDDSLLDARLTVAGLGKMEAAEDAVYMEADKLTVKWFDEHRVA